MQEKSQPMQELEKFEAAQQANLIALRTLRLSEINAKMIWDFADLSLMANVPEPTMERIIRRFPPKAMFVAGRRRQIMADQGRIYLQEMAEHFITGGVPKVTNGAGRPRA